METLPLATDALVPAKSKPTITVTTLQCRVSANWTSTLLQQWLGFGESLTQTLHNSLSLSPPISLPTNQWTFTICSQPICHALQAKQLECKASTWFSPVPTPSPSKEAPTLFPFEWIKIFFQILPTSPSPSQPQEWTPNSPTIITTTWTKFKKS